MHATWTILLALLALHCPAGGTAAESQQAVVALYRSEGVPNDARARQLQPAVEWRLERTADYVAVSSPGHSVAEHWQRDAQGRIWYRRIFHAERKVIEYRPSDLDLAGVSASWQQVSSVIDPQALKQLSRIGEQAALDRPAVVYRGVISGAKIEVWWLEAERLPARIVRHTPNGTSTLTLQNVRTLRAQEEVAHDLTGYETLDFADLGDRQGDPFVERLMKYEGLWFGHAR